MAKNGLIITYYFPPAGGGGVQRWTKFIKYLSKHGWQFDIITRAPSSNENLDKSLLKELPDSLNIKTINDTVSIQHYKLLKPNSNYWLRWIGSLFFITDSRKSWTKAAWPVIKNEIESSQYDVVICSIPPYTISDLAVKIKEKFKSTPVVLDLRDPWSTNPYKIYPTPIHRILDEKKEIKNVSKIDFFISAYNSTLKYYSKIIKGFEKKESIVISNGYDDEDFADLGSKDLPDPNSFNLAFSGTFYSHLNNPILLFKAMAHLSKQGQKIIFHHVGASAYDVNKLARKYGIADQIICWGYQSHKICLEILNSMDAFVVMLDSKVRNADKTIGGKVYEYLRLKKPILGLVPKNGEAAQLIVNTKSGIICDSLKFDEVAKSISTLKSIKLEFSGLEQYGRSNLANRLNTYLSKIIDK